MLMLKILAVWLFIFSKQKTNKVESSTDFNTTIRNSINGQAISLAGGGYLLFLNNSTTTTSNQIVPTDELSPHRIVGGKRIRITKAPWTVAIIENGRVFCGGSVIRPRWVLTAAHCVDGGGRFVLRAGTRWFRSGGQTRRSIKSIMHPSYNRNTFNNDIALIKINRRFNYGRFVRPVKLPRANAGLPNGYFVSGWGLRNENHYNPSKYLRRAFVYRINRPVCRADYAGQVGITKNMICAQANGKDSCSGDSGGPLTRRGIQYGIVSFGIGCARPRYPGVYTDLRKYRRFINFTVKNK